MKKLCYIASVPAAINSFLRVHIQAAAKNYQVTVICNDTDKHLLDGLNARIIILPFTRKPSPWHDLRILFQLFTLYRREKFDIVHSITPKIGLLAMLASWLAHIPTRVHTFTGQVWVTKYGVKRVLLKWLDKIIGRLATCIIIDSPSQRDFLVNEKVLQKAKTKVIGAGSICGIDNERFQPNIRIREKIRNDLGIAQDAQVILFVGRLNRDKGILDLAVSFEMIAKNNKNVVLLLVGAQEDVSFDEIKELCHDGHTHIHYLPFTSTPEYYMMAADIFCLPSYREGFGMTIIEAAACEVPTVGSRIYGITDAVEDEKTGLLFTAGNITSLTQTLLRFITDQKLCQQMGKNARIRTLKLFQSSKIAEEMLSIYDALVKK